MARKQTLVLLLFVGLQQNALGNDQQKQTYVEKVRMQVSEALNLAGGAKAAIAEYRLDVGRLPVNNKEAGLTQPERIVGKFTSSVTVIDGALVIEFGGRADAAISGRTLVITPTVIGEAVTWSCRSGYIESRYLPSTCIGMQ